MKNRSARILSLSLCIIAMLLLIYDSKYAIEGAKEGVELCIYTVIPTLFPFCVLSIILRSLLSDRSLPILRPIERLCAMPKGCGTIFLIGALGGYPIGAICIEQAVKDKSLTQKEARYLRAVCNNAGPSFIIGMVAASFQNMRLGLNLIIIQALSAALSCLLLSGELNGHIQMNREKSIKVSEAIKQSCSSMANICGIIVFFRAFMNVAKVYLSPYISKELWTMFIGTLELTNGIISLSVLSREDFIFIAAAGMLSFGGLCVAMQTISISSPGAGKYYLIGKSLQAVISILLAYLYVKLNVVYIPVYMIIFAFIKLMISKLKNKNQKTVAIRI